MRQSLSRCRCKFFMGAWRQNSHSATSGVGVNELLPLSIPSRSCSLMLPPIDASTLMPDTELLCASRWCTVIELPPVAASLSFFCRFLLIYASCTLLFKLSLRTFLPPAGSLLGAVELTNDYDPSCVPGASELSYSLSSASGLSIAKKADTYASTSGMNCCSWDSSLRSYGLFKARSRVFSRSLT